MKRTVICMLLLLTVMTAWAYDFKVDSLCYNILSVSERTVEVARKARFEGKVENLGDVVIPETVQFSGKTFTVVAIGSYAFGDYIINSISIPKTVKEIKRLAFNKTKIETFVVPKTVEGIISFPDAENLIIEESSTPLHIYVNGTEEGFYDHWGFDETNKSKKVYIGRTLEAEDGYRSLYFSDKTVSITFGKFVSPQSITVSLVRCTAFRKGGGFGGNARNTNPLIVKLEHETPPVLTLKSGFEKNVYLAVKLLVPAASLSKYQSAPIWKDFFDIEGY